MKQRNEVSAGGIVYKKQNGQVLWLMTQHSQHKGWGFPKGLIADVDKHETMEQAALREVKEEGGVETRIMNHDPVETEYKYKFKDYLVNKKVYYYLMEYLSGDPEDHDWEVQEALFAPEEKVVQTLTYQADKDAFMKILKTFGAA